LLLLRFLDRALALDVAALYSMQAASFLLPLVTVPFLARVLGPAQWGLLAAAESLGRTISVLAEYGFQYSATRSLAAVRDCPPVRSQRAAAVLSAQLLLAAVVLTICLAVSLWSSFAPRLFWLGVLYGLGLAASPSWFFQALQRARCFATIDLLARAIALLLVVAYIRRPEQASLVLLLWAGAAWTTSLLGLALARREDPWPPPSPALACQALREGFPLFLFRLATALYSSANPLILSWFTTPAAVGAYAGAEKIVRAAAAALAPWNQAILPRIAHFMNSGLGDASRLARWTLAIMLGLALAAMALLQLLASWLIARLLGPQYLAAVPLLRTLAILLPCVAVSNVLGLQWMIPLRLERPLGLLVGAAGLTNLALAPLLIRMAASQGLACSVVLAEALVTASLFLYLGRRGLLPWKKPAHAAESSL